MRETMTLVMGFEDDFAEFLADGLGKKVKWNRVWTVGGQTTFLVNDGNKLVLELDETYYSDGTNISS